jgi:hypothetical protein
MWGAHPEIERDDRQLAGRERAIEVGVGRAIEMGPGAAVDVDQEVPRGRPEGPGAANGRSSTATS